MARFMEIKCINPRTRKDQIAKELGCSSSTLQRYKNDISMRSPYRVPPYNTNKDDGGFQIQISMTIHNVSVTLKDLA